ncbi:MAG: HD domain-containing protein [Bacteroidetes bacterium]|nr:HD domain-containing protein [Bacteroidota bacterium]
MVSHHPTIENILHSYRESLGTNFSCYRNHVYRVYNFVATGFTDPQDLELLAVAAAFHDLGIWTHHTFDYLQPSNKLAEKYAIENHIPADKANTLFLIIDQHHKLSKISTSPLAEAFRVADLVDLSLGLIRKGVNKKFIQEVKREFPNQGFHIFLIRIFLKNLFTHPMKPLPMYKW